MPALENRVAIITGAGRGMGRCHALLFAQEGAAVVVNDTGWEVDRPVGDEPVAQEVVDEIVAAGGLAVASTEDVSDWEAAGRLIDSAVEAFGRVDVLVNNAGIIRDRLVVDMEEEDWDDLLRVNLKGTFGPLRWAARHWRDRVAAGEDVNGAVVNVSSASGLFGMAAESNYGAAKAAIGGLTVIAARELIQYGVRVNAIAPEVRTRMSRSFFLNYPDPEYIFELFPEGTLPEGIRDLSREQLAELMLGGDALDPSRVSPAVAYLATRDCPLNGEIIEIGNEKPVSRLRGWSRAELFERDGPWDIESLADALGSLRPAGDALHESLASMAGEKDKGE
jgi:NAD(P)-dependent dehydrogenase (short-subunit alcohol dehydrogenase family)